MFSPGHPVSSTNKTDRHDTTEVLLKVVLNTIKQTITGYIPLLFPDGIIRPAISVSAMTLFIKFIYYDKMMNNVYY